MRDLISKDQDKVQDSIVKVLSTIKENLTPEVFNRVSSDQISEIKSLEKDFNSKKIPFSELLKKLGDLLD